MRVVSGSARGCRLNPVPGMNTRPTTDRVKENIYNVIQNRIRDAVVLDLFAGTGQLGIEALSRGAKHCDFVERDKAALDTVRRNLTAARVGERAAVHALDAAAFVSRAPKNRYDVVFLDPPYSGQILQNTLSDVERFDILSANGIIICESAVDNIPASGFETVRSYRYGATMITVLQRAAERKN